MRLATDFLTSGTPTTITGITAAMGNMAVITHTITFSIFTDNGSGKPGTLLNAFDTLASLDPGNPAQQVTATDPGINLLANTPYWLVAQVSVTPTLGSVTWRFNSGQGTNSGPFTTVSGTEMQRSTNAGATYLNNDIGNQRYSLEGIPEPSSLTLLAFAAVSLAGGARLRRSGRYASR
jgi:hypothetical protein